MTTVGTSSVSIPPIDEGDVLQSIPRRFAEVVRAVPASLAVSDHRTTLTYAELDGFSDELAARISGRRRQGGGLVALCLEQGSHAVAAMVAALKAGHPYSVLDVTVPPARLGEISAMARPQLVLADVAHGDLARTMVADPASVVIVDEGTTGSGEAMPAPQVSGQAPANIVFTSGSTGRPKGVIVTHGAYLDHARAGRLSMDFGPGERMAMVLPLGFAAGALALHRALGWGAEIHLYDPRVLGIEGLASWMRSRRITYVDMTPTMLRALVATLAPGEQLGDLRVVATAGEAVFGSDVAGLVGRLAPGSIFINHAGSSETSGYAVCLVPLDRPLPDGQIPSGTVLGDRTLTLVADDGSDVVGEGEGELHVTSRFVSLGYWDQPELTAERFTTLPDGQRRFRVGDRCFRRPDGVLEHRGRLDQMVKIRGYLVEPIEVEAALRASGQVSAAVVFGISPAGQPSKLVTYAVPAGRTTSPASVRQALRQVLPSYMVPSVVILVEEIPRNANGKVDLQAIKALPLPGPSSNAPPRDQLELRLTVAWADILGIDTIGVEDDFFELGGDSLAAEVAMAALQEEFGLDLPTSVLLEAPTVAELARKVREPGSTMSPSMLVPLRRTGSRPPLFVLAGVGGFGVTYLPMSLYLGSEQPVYVIQNQGLENRGLPDRSVTRAARRALDEVRAIQPGGPYLLAGHSWGGIVAYEMARLLSADGEQVAFLGLIDVLDPRFPDFDDTVDGTVSAVPAQDAPRAQSYASGVPSKVAGLCRQAWLVVQVVVSALSGSPRTPRKVNLFARYSMILARHYKFRSWAGSATILIGEDDHDGRVPMDWDGIVLGPSRRVAVPGDHRSVLREPNARALASAISAAIDRVVPGGTEPPEG